MDNVNAKPVETGYEMDEELKSILAKRYEDMSNKFTPEAQQERRNNRLKFTFQVSVFLLSVVYFTVWAASKGFASPWTALLVICICMIVIGYNIGVCVSHNKGWRGA